MPVKITCDAFLVPDMYSLYKDLPDHVKENYGDKFREMLGREPVDSDVMVGLWNTDGKNKNMNDISFTTKQMDGYQALLPSWWPAGILTEAKEGDRVTTTFHLNAQRFEPEYDTKSLEVEVTMTLTQKKYRYSRYGDFETVLQTMVNQLRERANG